MPEDNKKIEIPAVPEVELTVTEKYGVNPSEVDAMMDIGDVTELVLRGELIEKKPAVWIFRKVGAAKRQGDIKELTVEDMRERLPKAQR